VPFVTRRSIRIAGRAKQKFQSNQAPQKERGSFLTRSIQSQKSTSRRSLKL
jgi:hypothetical protein